MNRVLANSGRIIAVVILALTSMTSILPQKVFAAFAGGDGSSEDPYQISSCSQLLEVDDNLLASYILTTDLDCTADGDATQIASSSDAFTGEFDGNGHILTINITGSDYVGLFGWLSDAEVSNLRVRGSVSGSDQVGGLVGVASNTEITNVSADVTVEALGGPVGGLIGVGSSVTVSNSYAEGDVSGVSSVGGFVGSTASSAYSSTYATGNVIGNSVVGGFSGGSYCATTHQDSYAAGNVTAEGDYVGGYNGADGCEGPGSDYDVVSAFGDVVGGSNVGGFSGDAFITHHNRTSATGNVTASGSNVGGLIGATEYDAVIEESLATGNVTADGDNAGGLIGRMNHGFGTINNSFARGNASADNNVGGLVGSAQGGSNILDSYSTGVPTASVANAGGLVGQTEDNSNMDFSFWDTETSGSSLSVAGTGKTTAEMKDVATYTTALDADAWDFGDVWIIESEINDGYPCLQWVGENCMQTDEEPDAPDSDLNGDAIPDSEQPNIGGYVSPVTGKIVAMDMGENCELTVDDITEEKNLETSDPAFEYDNGLFEFAADCTVETTTIKLYYYDVSPTGLVARKYSTLTNTYFALTDAVITTQTINGHAVTVVTYQLTDNSERDMDPEVGSIEDPAGLGRNIITAPNTGLEKVVSI